MKGKSDFQFLDSFHGVKHYSSVYLQRNPKLFEDLDTLRGKRYKPSFSNNEKTPSRESALAISRIDLIGKWGLTPVLEARQDPPSCGESQISGPPPLFNDRSQSGHCCFLLTYIFNQASNIVYSLISCNCSFQYLHMSNIILNRLN
ncbi:CLUMA_CG015437, isoform A [Clunio marinus]|uniref:CLUMA_CG015437, isoform A n=1 Tax=Clunio marinus TaxID=568069 RepID=A0A1J1IUV5_9DIPT|nr:CLUMA_CG015437, isoform A [Clunio marinus]